MRETVPEINLTKAFMDLEGFDREGNYSPAARTKLKEILEGGTNNWLDKQLEKIHCREEVDRRNGSNPRHISNEMLRNIIFLIPRTQRLSRTVLIKKFFQRPENITQMMLSCFVLGLSDRKVTQVLLPILGEAASASTVSVVARQLDASVQAYHCRVLKNRYQVLIFGRVAAKYYTGGRSMERTALVALGIWPDGKKEVIDYYQLKSESEAEWLDFLNDLYQRGLTGEGVELIVFDGGKELLAALGLVYTQIPVQHCWVHKSRNVLDKVKKKDRKVVARDLHQISKAQNHREARSAVRRFCNCWKDIYPKMVEYLLQDLKELLEFLSVPKNWYEDVRTINAIKRRFREVRRRVRSMEVLSDCASFERILFAIFSYENYKEETLYFSCDTK